MTTRKKTTTRTRKPKAEASAPAPAKKERIPMTKTLGLYKTGYASATTYRGTKSLNNGDFIAKLLAGAEPLTVCKLADRVLKEDDGSHATKYERLNPGHKRMNAGNRIRAFWKRDPAAHTAEIEAAAKGLGIKVLPEAA